MPAVMTYDGLVADIKSYVVRDNDSALNDMIPTLVMFAQRRISRELDILGLQQYVTGSFAASQGVVVKPNRWLSTLSINYGSSKNTVTSIAVATGRHGLYLRAGRHDSRAEGAAGPLRRPMSSNGIVTEIAVTAVGSGYTSTPTVTVADPDISTGTTATATATRSTADTKRGFVLPRSYEYCRSYWPEPNSTGEPRFYSDYGFSHWLVVPTPDAAYPIEIAYYELSQLLDDTNQTNWLTENAPDVLLYASLLETAPFLENNDKIEMWQTMYDRAAKGYQAQDKGRMTDRAMTRSK
jgi:hypothetical protein